MSSEIWAVDAMTALFWQILLIIESDRLQTFNGIASVYLSLSPVLLLRNDAVGRLLANGRAAFIESCDALGWKDCSVGDSVILL